MFTCKRCKKTINAAPIIMVAEKRERIYKYTIAIKKNYIPIILNRDHNVDDVLQELKKDRIDIMREKTTKGWEIVREELCCKECANKQ